MSAKKLLSLWGLKWNPFTAELPGDALLVTAKIESEGVKMVVDCHDPLPVVRVDQIPREENAQRWLVDGLWGDSSVGVVGGAPKCSKTWLGLDLALSVASGTPCLGR